MELVDTHCHLQFEKFNSDLDGVLERASENGVKRMICVGTTLKDSHMAAEIAAANDRVFVAIGWHPHEAAKYYILPGDSWEQMDKLVNTEKVIAVGECGLDYHYDNAEPEKQEIIFRFQIEMLALKYKLPVIFHVRDAWKDFWRITDDYEIPNAVVHSFSSGQKQLDRVLEKGWHVGLNGIITFTKDNAQLEAAKHVPLERLLLETDAPFLTPAPYRGQICEPKHTAATAEFLAKLRGESMDELSKTTTDNAVRLFQLK